MVTEKYSHAFIEHRYWAYLFAKHMYVHQVDFFLSSTCTKSVTSIEQVNISQMQALSSLEMIVQDYVWMPNTCSEGINVYPASL